MTLDDRVLDLVAAVTRYPRAVLVPDALVEDELGIDSVKQAEILAVLSRELGVTREVRRGQVRTLRDLVELCRPTGAAPAVQTPAVAEVSDLLAELRTLVAQVTRYPEAVLTAEAHLEDELGIDSVKRAEIVAVVARRYPAVRELEAGDRIDTLGALADALSRRMGPPLRAVEPATPPTPEPRAPRRPLEGKVALVTGSGRGLGRVIALRLAEQGATVVVNAFHSRDAGEATAREIRAAGGSATFVWGSVAQEAQVAEIFRHVDAEHGRLDLLVCNASDGVIAPFEEVTPKDWDRAFRTCVTGTHLCAMAAAERMRGEGAVVTMSTVTAHRYLRGFGSQGVVKAAVESLTRYLACELGPRGIRVNCVSAGPVHGELLDRFPDRDALVARWERITPGGSLCRPEDVAAVVEMLLDPRSARVNGAVWVVDNGVSAQIDGRLVDPASRSALALVR